MDKNKEPIARLRWGEQEYLLYQESSLRIGRSNENDLVLTDPKISRMHAELVWDPPVFTLRDLGSVNGTFINGERLSETGRVLRDGDIITFNKQNMTFEMVRADRTETLHDPFGAGASVPGLPTGGASLAVISGPDMGQEFPLWGEIITIGRASREATWEIRLTDRAVSRPHARLERRPEAVFLIDLESANGTLLNGQSIAAPMQVKEGDVISVGETHLVYHAG